MPWFKVDDTLAFHPKIIQAGNAAIGLWIRAGAWSAQQLTDGHVPRHMISILGSGAAAKALVAVGLWEQTETGYRFHDWTDYQPSKQDVLADRKAANARQQVMRNPELREAIRTRDQDRCRYCGIGVRWNDRRGNQGGTYDHVHPDGPSDLDNLVVACRGCNSSKGRRTPAQAGMRLIQVGVKSELGRI